MVSPRFDYGSFTDDDVMIKSPSVKMLSLSSADDDYPEFLTYRAKNLASLPKEATKADVQKLIAQEGSSSGGDDGSSDAATSDEMPAYTVNAAYDPSYNAIFLPAGLQAPPLFAQGQPDYLNYGSYGAGMSEWPRQPL